MERSNEKALKILEQQYNGFMGLKDWDFFRGLAEYVKTVQEMVPTNTIVKALDKQREEARKVYEQMNTDAFKELQRSANKVTKIAKEYAKQSEPILEFVKEIEAQKSGIMRVSDPLDFLERSLHEIATRLKATGLADTIKQFEDNKKAIQNIYGNYTFSPTYLRIPFEEKKLERREQAEAWGAWSELPIVARVILEPEKLNEESREDLEKSETIIREKTRKPYLLDDFEDIRVQEMDQIRSGRRDAENSVFFKISKFKNYANRAHTYIITELTKNSVEESKLEFDIVTSTLYFADEKIKISDRANSDAHDLLKIIFSDTSKLWNNDEILEELAFNLTKAKVPKNKVYQAGKAVNRSIAQETTIKDFLVLTTKTVAINKKYLK